MAKETIKKIKGILSGLLTVFLIIILSVSVVQKILGKTPGLFGYHFMYVLTGSMEPEISAGDAILVKECTADSVKLDDVICYRAESGEMAGKMITHKVIRETYKVDGETFLQTQGTANITADDPIRADQVYGKVVTKLVILGMLFRFFCTVPGLICVSGLIIWMMVGEIRNIYKAAKEEPETAADENAENEEQKR